MARAVGPRWRGGCRVPLSTGAGREPLLPSGQNLDFVAPEAERHLSAPTTREDWVAMTQELVGERMGELARSGTAEAVERELADLLHRQVPPTPLIMDRAALAAVRLRRMRLAGRVVSLAQEHRVLLAPRTYALLLKALEHRGQHDTAISLYRSIQDHVELPPEGCTAAIRCALRTGRAHDIRALLDTVESGPGELDTDTLNLVLGARLALQENAQAVRFAEDRLADAPSTDGLVLALRAAARDGAWAPALEWLDALIDFTADGEDLSASEGEHAGAAAFEDMPEAAAWTAAAATEAEEYVEEGPAGGEEYDFFPELDEEEAALEEQAVETAAAAKRGYDPEWRKQFAFVPALGEAQPLDPETAGADVSAGALPLAAVEDALSACAASEHSGAALAACDSLLDAGVALRGRALSLALDACQRAGDGSRAQRLLSCAREDAGWTAVPAPDAAAALTTTARACVREGGEALPSALELLQEAQGLWMGWTALSSGASAGEDSGELVRAVLATAGADAAARRHAHLGTALLDAAWTHALARGEGETITAALASAADEGVDAATVAAWLGTPHPPLLDSACAAWLLAGEAGAADAAQQRFAVTSVAAHRSVPLTPPVLRLRAYRSAVRALGAARAPSLVLRVAGAVREDALLAASASAARALLVDALSAALQAGPAGADAACELLDRVRAEGVAVPARRLVDVAHLCEAAGRTHGSLVAVGELSRLGLLEEVPLAWLPRSGSGAHPANVDSSLSSQGAGGSAGAEQGLGSDDAGAQDWPDSLAAGRAKNKKRGAAEEEEEFSSSEEDTVLWTVELTEGDYEWSSAEEGEGAAADSLPLPYVDYSDDSEEDGEALAALGLGGNAEVGPEFVPSPSAVRSSLRVPTHVDLSDLPAPAVAPALRFWLREVYAVATVPGATMGPDPTRFPSGAWLAALRPPGLASAAASPTYLYTHPAEYVVRAGSERAAGDMALMLYEGEGVVGDAGASFDAEEWTFTLPADALHEWVVANADALFPPAEKKETAAAAQG